MIDKGGDINQISRDPMKIIDECSNLRVRSEIEKYVNENKTDNNVAQAASEISESAGSV